MNEPHALGVRSGRWGPRLGLASGDSISLEHPDAGLLTPEVLACSLSRLARFNGHTIGGVYTVAQHSVVVSRLVAPEHALAGLMHDGAESLVGDITRPLKLALERAGSHVLNEIEDRVGAALARRYGYAWPLPEAVHHADRVALATELRDLTLHDPHADLPDPMRETLHPWGPKRAERAFLARFAELKA